MDFQRLLLYLALFLVLFLLWESWQQDYGPRPQVESSTATQEPATATPDIPAGVDVPAGVPAADKPAVADDSRPAVSPGNVVTVSTDVLELEIDLVGGTIRQAKLLDYPVTRAQPDTPFTLLDANERGLYVAQSGILGDAAPDHHAVFTSPSMQYSLADGADTLDVALTWNDPSGVTVTKTFTFKRGEYLVDVAYQVDNKSDQDWTGRLYSQLQRSTTQDEKSTGGFGGGTAYTYTGGAISSSEKRYEKITFDDMAEQDLSRDIAGGWVAMIQHYFVSSWIPNQDETHHYYTKALSDSRYILGMVSGTATVSPGSRGTLTTELYVGPKIQKQLAEVADGLDLTVDLGWLWFIAQPLFWLLDQIHRLVGNWGWSIIFITMIIKLAFYYPSALSYRSMANMRRLGPKLQALRERYGGDKQRLNQAMMEIYKKEKINPLGGCLPILIQIPVFISLYWVLLESVELRHAPFALWIQDLSSKDPYFVLPVLMGVTMFIQQKLNPKPPDPIQAKVMMSLPFIFTVFFAFFPAGLVLYWLVNNILSIAQQWYITQGIEKAAAARSA